MSATSNGELSKGAIVVARPILRPVVEIGPWDFAKEGRACPEVGPASAYPGPWLRYWEESLSDAGIHGLTPIKPGSIFVDVGLLGASPHLPAIIENQLRGAGIKGFPDDDRNEESFEERVPRLRGGYALLEGDEVLIEPKCCGDLGNLANWRLAAARVGPDWQDLWIGHPWLEIRSVGDDLEIGETQEYPEPEPPRVFSVTRDALLAAVDHGERIRDGFRVSIERALQTMEQLSSLTSADKVELAGRLAGTIEY